MQFWLLWVKIRLMDQQELTKLLLNTPVNEVRYLDSAGSTNDIAREWAEQGAPDFTLVAADNQTAGRGRMQRTWITKPGEALAFSLILRLSPEETTWANLLPFIAGAAVCSALENQLSLKPQIKWPNDILLNGKKAAGILVETTWQEGNVAAVVGIGVNITPAALPPVEGLALPATCVETAAGRPLERWQLLGNILISLGGWRKANPDLLISYISQRLAYHGQQVYVINNYGPEITGKFLGIDRDGALQLDTPEGVTQIQVGDVHLRLKLG